MSPPPPPSPNANFHVETQYNVEEEKKQWKSELDPSLSLRQYMFKWECYTFFFIF